MFESVYWHLSIKDERPQLCYLELFMSNSASLNHSSKVNICRALSIVFLVASKPILMLPSFLIAWSNKKPWWEVSALYSIVLSPMILERIVASSLKSVFRGSYSWEGRTLRAFFLYSSYIHISLNQCPLSFSHLNSIFSILKSTSSSFIFDRWSLFLKHSL